MKNIIQKLKIASNNFLSMNISASEAVTFSNGILLLQESISELEKQEKNKPDAENAKEQGNGTDEEC